MLRQSDIAVAFRESVLRNSKGYRICIQRILCQRCAGMGCTLPTQTLMRGYLESRRTLSTKPPTIAKTGCG